MQDLVATIAEVRRRIQQGSKRVLNEQSTKSTLVILALCSALLGCPTLVAPPGPIKIQTSGTWVHPASGLTFPEEISGYRRVDIARFDEPGLDIGVGYNYESYIASVAFTVYARRPQTPIALAEQFELEKRVVHDHHPGTQESWAREEFFLAESGSVPVRAAEFRYTEDFSFRRQAVISQIYLFEVDGWLLKYRLTFAEGQEDRGREMARRMLRSAPWGWNAP